ncbi:DUF6185 family protein [Streptomyces sp. NPDC001796]|uniref:DUF6185 family protein n=1 Tax=Streptomyces sp. NPDC001796 TaxID=3364609 RepID=UPI003679DB59
MCRVLAAFSTCVCSARVVGVVGLHQDLVRGEREVVVVPVSAADRVPAIPAAAGRSSGRSGSSSQSYYGGGPSSVLLRAGPWSLSRAPSPRDGAGPYWRSWESISVRPSRFALLLSVYQLRGLSGQITWLLAQIGAAVAIWHQLAPG